MKQGDTIEIRDRRSTWGVWGIGFIEEPINEFGDTKIFLRNYDIETGPIFYFEGEPRWFFGVNVDPKFEMIYTTTRMVLTEKNRYVINHGGKDFESIWQ